MGEYVLLTIVLLLSLYGCAEGIRWLVLRILRPPKDTGGVLVIPLSGHRTDVEYIVRSVTACERWGGNGVHTRVLLLDAGMDAETRRLAERVCEEVGGIGLYTEEELLFPWQQST